MNVTRLELPQQPRHGEHRGDEEDIAASVFHYGQLTVAQAKAAMRNAGIEVREVRDATEVA